MQIYNLKFIKTISDMFGAEYGRAVEIGLLAGISYIMWVIMTGNIYSFQALTVAIITPLWAAVNKKFRDIQNGN